MPGFAWGSRGGVGGLQRPPDVECFLDVCVAGKYYESFSADRDRVKKATMPILSGPVCYQNSRIVQQFKAMYPSADAMLADLKTNNSLPKAIRHKQSSRLLQYIEASMFIGRICQRAMKEDVPVITLHASPATVWRGCRREPGLLMCDLERQADAGDTAAPCALVQACDAGPAGTWVLEEFGADDLRTVDWVLCQMVGG